jgi:hypothetical protein
MLRVLPPPRSGFIEPCLPSAADKPPSGSNWIHEIKHDGYRLMARRDPVGIRLITRRGNDWTARFPLVVEAVNSRLMQNEPSSLRPAEVVDHPGWPVKAGSGDPCACGKKKPRFETGLK